MTRKDKINFIYYKILYNYNSRFSVNLPDLMIDILERNKTDFIYKGSFNDFNNLTIEFYFCEKNTDIFHKEYLEDLDDKTIEELYDFCLFLD